MPPVGASEGVDRLKMAVRCRDGCQLVAGIVADKLMVLIWKKPASKGFYDLSMFPATKATRFYKKTYKAKIDRQMFLFRFL